MLLTLYPPKEKTVIRCCNCLEVGQIASYRASDTLPLCNPCTTRSNPLFLKPGEYLVYKALQEDKNLLAISKKLNISVGRCKAIALHLQSLGLQVEWVKGYTVLDTQDNPVLLTQKQYDVWAIASTKYLLNYNYKRKCAEELGMNYSLFGKHVVVLRGKGIYVPTPEERKEKFKKYVLDKIRTSKLSRPTLIIRIARDTGHCFSLVSRVVKEIEDETGARILSNNYWFWEEVYEKLPPNQELTIPQINKFFPERSRASIRWVVEKLQDENLITVDKRENKLFVLVNKDVAA